MRFLIVTLFLIIYIGITFGSSEVDSINQKISDLKKCCKSKIIKHERSPRTKKINSDCLEEDYVKSAVDDKQLCQTYCINLKLGAYDPESGFNNTLYSTKMRTFIIKDADWKTDIDTNQITELCFKNLVPNLEKCSIEFLKSKYCFWKEISKHCPQELRNSDFC
ncbi:hypothetical protein ACFFRR_011105 [Megaselia abdita]